MRVLSNCIAFALSLFLTTISFAAAKPKNDYITRYLDIAIMEKERSGIPISIILGQGIFESGWGDATLAIDANNHFGIKCGKYWNGYSYSHKDDDYDSEGNLIESCFRMYESPEHSYIDHTDFLMSGERYEFLFSISGDNYREWAYGLKKAGYATDSTYAEKLIKIIETYELYKYDNLLGPIKAVESPFFENKFEKNAQIIPLGKDEIFELGSGEVNQELNIEKITVDEYNPPKAVRISDSYFPFNRKRFDNFFKNIKTKVKQATSETETLDEISPKNDEFKARGIDSEKSFIIVKERKVKR